VAGKVDKAGVCADFRKNESNDNRDKYDLPERKLTQAEADLLMQERACVRSYSSGFPGKEEAFLKANSTALRKDLDQLPALFEPSAKLTGQQLALAMGTDPQWQRKYEIAQGWDRTQVLLWGNFFYVRQLYKERAYKKVIVEVARVRKTFGLTVAPLKNWDKAEANTYFSQQSLRNMLANLEYGAKAQLADTPEAKEALAKAFAADRDALKPFYKFTGDFDADILDEWCSP
jgi:phosphopantetheinyl transferase (holo-ACP synthase)